MAGQLLRDGREQRLNRAADRLQAWRELKACIDARALLADLSRSHGVQAGKYEVSKGRDGADRIRCGGRHLNVSDFLTQELHLPWTQAQVILRQAAQRQREQGLERQPMAAPNPALWAEFSRRRRQIVGVERAVKRQQTGLAARKSRQAITDAFHDARARAAALPPAQRRAQTSLARMRRITAQARLRDILEVQRAEARREGRRPVIEHYRQFLQERAQLGSDAALEELRRLAPPRPADPAPQGSWILAGNDDEAGQARHALYGELGLTFTVASNGDVTYQRQGRALMRDTARKIDVLSDDAQTLQTALRLAQQKFGSSLELSGSKAFQDKVARAAAEGRLGVRFADERLNRVMRARGVELNVGSRTDAGRLEPDCS